LREVVRGRQDACQWRAHRTCAGGAGMSSASITALRVKGATKQFGGLKVFEGISFEVAPGGVMGVIGPNGAGKTTLINVMCGMLKPTSGRILIGDQDI